MKTLVLCALTLGIASSAFGSACGTSTSFSTLISEGSCTFVSGGHTYTLQDFTFLNVAVLTQGMGPGDFSVSESTNANGPVVTITPDSSIGINSTLAANEEFLFGFDITSSSPTIGFSSVTLGEQSALTGLSTGLVAEEDCFGGALPAPNALLSLGSGGLACLGGGVSVGASVALSNVLGANASVGIPLNGPLTNSVDVLKEISLTALLGSADVTGVSQSFATEGGQVAPEPSSLFLGGCGLVGLGFLRRNRKRRIN